jgi:ribosomal-protein-alanine N-acetyltransferase
MTPADVDRVIEIAESLREAPQWTRSAYLAALDPAASPARIALVAQDPSGAEALVDSIGVTRGLKPPPPSDMGFSAACGEDECGRIAGFLVASLLPPQAELELIAVALDFQRQGLARQLFAALASELGAALVTEVLLEVRASNHPALGLYRRLRFVETGRRTRYYRDPVEDAVLMRLRL